MMERWTIITCDECGFERLQRRPGGGLLDHVTHGMGTGDKNHGERLVEVIPADRERTLMGAIDEFLTAACDPPPEGLAAAIERLNDRYAALGQETVAASVAGSSEDKAGS